MGNAFIAVADDENALFYNPAGLSRTKRLDVGIFNPFVGISDKMIDLISDAGDADLDDTGEVADLLRKYIGEHQHFTTGFYPYVGFNVANVGVMVAGLGQGTINADIRNPVWPEADVDMILDYGLVGGAGAAEGGEEVGVAGGEGANGAGDVAGTVREGSRVYVDGAGGGEGAGGGAEGSGGEGAA